MAEDRLSELEMASLMTYLASGAKGSRTPPITSEEVSIWHYYSRDFL